MNIVSSCFKLGMHR